MSEPWGDWTLVQSSFHIQLPSRGGSEGIESGNSRCRRYLEAPERSVTEQKRPGTRLEYRDNPVQ